MSDAAVRGRFLWYELMTNDTDAAKRFYPPITGWGTTAWEGSPVEYTMWTHAQGPVGGLADLAQDPASQGIPPHWLAYIGTPNVDATVARAQGLGGTLMVGPMDIPGVGRFAVMTDPQGVVFAPYTPEGPPSPQAEGPTPLGAFSWHELVTTDHEAAFRFYSELFGWNHTDTMDMGPMGTYQMYGHGQKTLGGMFNKSSDMPAPPHWIYYVHVADMTAALDAVRAGGGQVLNGPHEVPGGDVVAQCMDPQGAMFALHAHLNKAQE